MQSCSEPSASQELSEAIAEQGNSGGQAVVCTSKLHTIMSCSCKGGCQNCMLWVPNIKLAIVHIVMYDAYGGFSGCIYSPSNMRRVCCTQHLAGLASRCATLRCASAAVRGSAQS